MDSLTAAGVLTKLRNTCLYLHYDGSRYCFKKDPNVTKLVEDAEQAVGREEAQEAESGPVRTRIKKMLEERLAKHPAEAWPAKSQDIPDREPQFVVAYLPLEFASLSPADQDRGAEELLYQYGDKPRTYRNAIGLAVPERKPVETLRRAVRYLLAVERVEANKLQHRLTKDQLDQLKERKRSEEAAAEASMRELYLSVWLPRMEKGKESIEKVEKGGRPLQATGLHDRIMELLTVQGSPKVHSTVTPRKVAERLKLGESIGAEEPPRAGVKLNDVQDAFFAFLEPPRLTALDALRAAVVRGVGDGTYGYLSGPTPQLGGDGKYQVRRDKIRFGTVLAGDEVDFETGFLIAPAALPDAGDNKAEPKPDGGTGGQPVGDPSPTGESDGAKQDEGVVARTKAFLFHANRSQLFKAFQALANLADKSEGGKVTVRIEATSAAAEGFDAAWLRNAVEEPLDEAGIDLEA